MTLELALYKSYQSDGESEIQNSGFIGGIFEAKIPWATSVIEYYFSQKLEKTMCYYDTYLIE